MNFFGFGPSAEVDIVLDGQDTRKTAEIKTEDGKKERHLLYYDGEHVTGKVHIHMRKPGSRLEHYGIKVELIGQIELYYDRGNHHDFLSLSRELARPGDLFQHTTYNFEFQKVEKSFESYTGSNVKLRYFLRVTIVRRLSDIVKEKEIVVHTLSQYPDMNSSIKMEVGIEDCLHIEFEYNKSKYHLKDVIVGKIYFLLVRIKIKHMEIAIIKRETTGSGPNTFNENETIAKYEIMDGAPVRGESIPIRVFLAGYELTPTMKDINKKFSVRYYLNLVLVDEEDRRYFKQQEIILWRKADKTRKPFQASLQQQYKQMQNPNVQFSNSDQSIAGSARNLGVHGEGENNSSRLAEEGNNGQLEGGSSSNRFRSPLEQSSSSEQPTPDKEFQSVINSQENTTMSPYSSDNPFTSSIPQQQQPQQQSTKPPPSSAIPSAAEEISPILESPPEDPVNSSPPPPKPEPEPQKEMKESKKSKEKEPAVAIAVAVEENKENSSSAATEAIISTSEETTEN